MIDPNSAWTAFEARDRSRDGEFVGAVKTTGIYCKPSCPARYRACLRCRPDEVGRDREAVAEAVRLIEAAEEPLLLSQLAAAVGYAPHHFQRLFKRDLGVSPAAYARALRARRTKRNLEGDVPVTEAIYDSGYAVPSRFYADAGERLGMTPSAWRDGGRGETIRWAIADSPLGPMLVAASARGICRLSFDEDESALSSRFHAATIVPDDGTVADLVEGALNAVREPQSMPDLPLDVAGTAFQEAVWQELRRIPPGEPEVMSRSRPQSASRGQYAQRDRPMVPTTCQYSSHATE